MGFVTPAVVGVVGALAGTVFGALLTSFLQRRNVALARLHEARITAYSTFAEAIMEFRKAIIDRWYHVDRGEVVDGSEVYSTRSSAWAAYYQVVLLAGDPEIVCAAEDARNLASTLKNVTTVDELDRHGEQCRQAVHTFAVTAGRQVSGKK